MECIDLRSNCMQCSMGAAQSSTQHRTLYAPAQLQYRILKIEHRLFREALRSKNTPFK